MSDMLITLRVDAGQLNSAVEQAKGKLGTLPGVKKTELKGDASSLSGAIAKVQKQMLTMAAGMFAVTKVWQTVTGVIRQTITEARDATIAQRLLASQLATTGNAAGLSAEELTKISGELQKMSNMGDDAIIKNLTVPLTTFRNIAGDVFERTQKAVLDLNAAIGNPNDPNSLKSVTIQLGKALNDPIQGLTALRRVGVSFSDSQIATIKNLAETNRLAEAQGLILDELQVEFGGAAEATIDSSLQMKNAWGDLLEAMGKKTLPALEAVNLSFANFFAVMSSNMGTYADNQAEIQQRMFGDWNGFTTAFMLNGRALGAFMIHTGSIVAGSIDSFFSIQRSAIKAHAKTIWDVLSGLGPAVMETLGMGNLDGLKTLATDIGDNYKKVGTDVSVYLKTLNAEFDNAISGLKNYEKDFTAITSASQASYNKQLELIKTISSGPGDDAGSGAGGGAVAKAVTAYQKLLETMKGYYRDSELARLDAYDKELSQLEDQKATEAEIINQALAKKEISKTEADAKLLELDTIYNDKSKLVLAKAATELEKIQFDTEQNAIKAKTEADAKKLQDQESYYDQMKYIDASYVAWRKEQVAKKVAEMDISDIEKEALLVKLLGDIDAEKDAANNLDLTGGQGNQRSWFFSDVLGYDPDNPQDQQKVSAIQTTYRNIVSGAASMVSQLVSLSQERKNSDIMAIEEKAAKEKWSNERLLSEKKKINSKYEAEERKLRNIQKGISITQAIINTAEGVTSALKMGPILGPIMAAMIGAMGAVQIGLIAAQKFASGGLFRGKGGPRDDQNIIAVSDHEYIVNAAATKRWLPLLDAINYGGAAGGAVASAAYASGGSVSGGYDIGGKLDKLIESVQIMNLNLVKKDMSVKVTATNGVDALVRKIDSVKARMDVRGYVPAV